ncbi:UDP-2,4-diacetamido-2,4,6-trideoxy-beta-L-altropyranose hydrolase [Salinicola sp. DM10]|uniref:UDP-2,4-diacetamido-2,4, 6-trideoxy-beta-L-altropyranose hydrolase n=1 Tax=Salinicola sp. DM10 TaxID=2815721 RepID=UPI001A8F233A|nr:UDP-2,4-diacetamido-2,4,6-trideoxy-beta-L-altropyranose hydrolase [Salinicola sp. DM10]MCE3025994.1 UDP-2,4-diacetamido-2,4,6-trideoxy-beta-L-altropyranose hydrolase [Salinicola sp. DM10]
MIDIAFRVDASLEIGTGHVMRCLTLATALREHHAARCCFLCRELPGHLIARIEAEGFEVLRLVAPAAAETSHSGQGAGEPAHAAWLGVDWSQDARESADLLAPLAPDWLVVDHYALDARWESAVRPSGTRLLIIDDLADREHIADLLLDQNLGRLAEDYAGLVPANCQLMIGPDYALLRPEFAEWRRPSLDRRDSRPGLSQLLISQGGVDKDNVTAEVLQALRYTGLPRTCRITVVMGATAPWIEVVKRVADTLEQPTEVVTSVSDMARRMAEADLAIGAAGSTSWERCCLGLPTLMLVLAENQRDIAAALERAGAAIRLDSGALGEDLSLVLTHVMDARYLAGMSESAARLVDGEGVKRLRAALAP